jgi:hypothetical protein
MFETTNQPIIDPKKYAAVVEWNQFPHVFFWNSFVRSQRRKAVSSNSLEMTWHL